MERDFWRRREIKDEDLFEKEDLADGEKVANPGGISLEVGIVDFDKGSDDRKKDIFRLRMFIAQRGPIESEVMADKEKRGCRDVEVLVLNSQNAQLSLEFYTQ